MAVTMAAAVVLTAGCQGDKASSAGSSSVPAPSNLSTTPTTPSVTPSAPASSQTTTRPTRTPADLRRALLGLKDLPTGFEVEKGSGGGDDDGTASSSRAGCAALVRLLNADSLPGSLADAAASFSGGPEGPYIDETLDAFASPVAAKGFVAKYRKAVTSCGAVTYSVRGVGKSTLKVSEVSFADLGSGTFAARFTAGSGALRGFELVQVAAQTGDVVVGMTCAQTDPSDAEAATSDAIDKVEGTLSTSKVV